MVKIKITNQEVVDLNNGLHAVGHLSGVKFAYAVSRNISKLKSEVTALQKGFSLKPDFEAYENERQPLAEKYAVKVDGKPQQKVEGGVSKFVIKDQRAFDSKFKTLKKKHKKAIDNREKQLKEFQLLLEEKVEIELYQVMLKDVPEGISAKQMSSILPIVVEDLTN